MPPEDKKVEEAAYCVILTRMELEALYAQSYLGMCNGTSVRPRELATEKLARLITGDSKKCESDVRLLAGTMVQKSLAL